MAELEARQSAYARYGKRPVDFLLASLLLVLALPALLAISLAIRLTTGRPLMFRQIRAGYHGRPFSILKFKTMTETRDDNGVLLPDGERVTRLGAWLRSTSLDELPELLNVVRGEMSLVGPRPLPIRYLERYTVTQQRRHAVHPGMTGLAQVEGRNALDWNSRLALDVEYVQKMSFVVDFRILLKTITTVFSRQGISAPGHATMPEFMGSQEEDETK